MPWVEELGMVLVVVYLLYLGRDNLSNRIASLNSTTSHTSSHAPPPPTGDSGKGQTPPTSAFKNFDPFSGPSF